MRFVVDRLFPRIWLAGDPICGLLLAPRGGYPEICAICGQDRYEVFGFLCALCVGRVSRPLYGGGLLNHADSPQLSSALLLQGASMSFSAFFAPLRAKRLSCVPNLRTSASSADDVLLFCLRLLCAFAPLRANASLLCLLCAVLCGWRTDAPLCEA
jgi:hypothetical protein